MKTKKGIRKTKTAGIIETLKAHGLEDLALSSAIDALEPVLDILSKQQPINNIIEIGTHNGLSTALLTNYCKKVFTFDITQRNQETVWALLGCREKIRAFVGTPEQIRYEIKYINKIWPEKGTDPGIDFAFLDGDHNYEGIANDFELCSFTHRALFHDYSNTPGVNTFCKEIQAVPMGYNDIFAYWKG